VANILEITAGACGKEIAGNRRRPAFYRRGYAFFRATPPGFRRRRLATRPISASAAEMNFWRVGRFSSRRQGASLAGAALEHGFGAYLNGEIEVLDCFTQRHWSSSHSGSCAPTRTSLRGRRGEGWWLDWLYHGVKRFRGELMPICESIGDAAAAMAFHILEGIRSRPRRRRDQWAGAGVAFNSRPAPLAF